MMPFFVNNIGRALQFNGIRVSTAGENTVNFAAPHFQCIVSGRSVVTNLLVGNVLLATICIVPEFNPRGDGKCF